MALVAPEAYCLRSCFSARLKGMVHLEDVIRHTGVHVRLSVLVAHSLFGFGYSRIANQHPVDATGHVVHVAAYDSCGVRPEQTAPATQATSLPRELWRWIAGPSCDQIDGTSTCRVAVASRSPPLRAR